MLPQKGLKLVVKVSKSLTFEILGHKIAAGFRKSIRLEVVHPHYDSPSSIPIEIINGKKVGPVLMVSAAVDGSELNGVEIVRKLVNTIDTNNLRGTLIAVPFVNVLELVRKPLYMLKSGSLSNVFPGNCKGSLASRVAYSFFSNVVERCDYILDLRTASVNKTSLPQIRANLANKETLRIAEAFATPVIIDSRKRDGSLRSVAENLGIPTLTFEAGEALRFEQVIVRTGFLGVTRLMRSIGMLRISRKKVPPSVIVKKTSWVNADCEGILRTFVNVGDRVEKGEILAYISCPLGCNGRAIVAKSDAIVIGKSLLPLVQENDAVINLAFLSDDSLEVEYVGETCIDDIPRFGIN
ncbi:succinylglutamate desuccinylase/aspartoacylase family protein [Vibrio jasicida]|uniref:succinylglutamate desuccinylase/aspartoacylase family protein n=1 Tax=Vibrio jasicida TaxID=766224 RepID=UPI0003AB1146|nr:succinylglutamate desuccinylase/aspartoacylase family protein [Vibrio jasicida]